MPAGRLVEMPMRLGRTLCVASSTRRACPTLDELS